jgi:hypothetical protein
MQIVKLADAATGWNGTVLTDDSGNAPPGGLLLTFLDHQGHNFASEVRVVGIWLEVESLDTQGTVTAVSKKFFALDDPHFDAGPVLIHRPVRVTFGTPAQGQSTWQYLVGSDDCLQFGTYFAAGSNPVGVGVRAAFTSKPALLAAWPNCEVSALTLTQSFLFSRYAMSPPHEPGGVLTAARFHPIMKYEWTSNPTLDRTKPSCRVKSLRVDYRINYNIDGALTSYTGPKYCQAGVFADKAALPIIGWAPFGLFSSSATSRSLFNSAEKPVLLELATPGYVNAAPLGTTAAGVEFRCWDNIHCWGARGVGNPLISTPGAFHASHMHWRWGAVTSVAPHSHLRVFRPGPLPPPSAAVPSAPQLQEFTLLVDPAAWIQSMEFALIWNDWSLRPAPGVALSKLSTSDFRQLFTTVRGPRPSDISAGTDLVQWMAITVHRELVALTTLTAPSGGIHQGPPNAPTVPVRYRTKPTGRIFIHGAFFAHEAEITGLGVGTTDPQHFPTSAKAIRAAAEWVRTA